MSDYVNKRNNSDKISHVTQNNTIADVINIPAFQVFRNFIFPLDYYHNTSLKLNHISALLPYHSHINTYTTLEVINYMIDRCNSGEKIFFDIYTDKEKQKDKSKEKTGLLFFRGEKNKPFAIICAGGGFSYVGSIHEAYPHALELSKKGYNAFVLQYRTDWEYANEDLAQAISYVMKNSKDLEVDSKDYSLWGSSAGGRMVANIGTYGVSYFGGDQIFKPAVVIIAYTGHRDYGGDEVPTFVVVGENDGIANPFMMKRRIDALSKMGIDTEFHIYPHLSHGFGLGRGTMAEGWIDDAILFWEKHID